MSAAAPNNWQLDLRPLEAARLAAEAERHARLRSRAAGNLPPTPVEPLAHPVVEAVAPRRPWRRPRLLIHPLTLGILAGVVAVFALAIIMPRQSAKPTAVPALAVPAVVAKPPAAKTAPAVIPAKPTDRLVVPALGINAPVISVGLVAGALDTPKTLWQVAHYKGSASVGATGTAIIVGHSGAPGQVGVFEHLNRLRVGDTLTYRYVDGRTFTYRVATSAAYLVNDDAAHLLFANTKSASLNLVSCYGTWNATTQQYDQRWIVTATLVTQ